MGIGEEVFPQDSDDGVGLIAQRERLAHDRRIAAEPALPQAVAQHHDLAAVGRVLLRGEGAAQDHRSAEEAEVALGDVDAVELLRMVAGEVVAGAGHVVGGHFLEDAGLPLVGVKLGNVGEEAVGQDGGVEEFDHAIGVGIAERLEQHRIDDAEDGGVGSDAQRQRGYGGDGEGGVLAEH